MLLAVVVVLTLCGLWWFSRTQELFCVSVRHGKLLVVRGRVPAGLMSDFRYVVSKPAVARGTLRAVKAEHGARLVVSGDIDEGRAQRLKNCFRLYPISMLRSAPIVGRPTLGQVLGIAWLAWLLDRRG